MSRDITRKLRHGGFTNDDLDFAADEIDRLRADCSKLEKSHGQLQNVIDGLTSELAAEREAKAFIQNELKSAVDRYVRIASNCEASERREAKLREALVKARGKMQYMIDNGEWYAPEETAAAIDAVLKETSNDA